MKAAIDTNINLWFNHLDPASLIVKDLLPVAAGGHANQSTVAT